jgi:hypothetical protein
MRGLAAGRLGGSAGRTRRARQRMLRRTVAAAVTLLLAPLAPEAGQS